MNTTGKFVVTTTLCPTNFNKPESRVVEAASGEAARAIVKDYLRDLGSYEKYIYSVKDYVSPPAGRIIGVVGQGGF